LNRFLLDARPGVAKCTTMSDPSPLDQRICKVLTEQARLGVAAATLADSDDLYQAGMSSHASVNVMLGLEAEFDVEFPDHMLTRSVFASIAAIRAALTELTAG
jgi:acyl carrier protein